jgi:hypothetical protein
VPWVKLDDQFFVNRKARSAGLEGRALFLASMCYCAMQLNDGTFAADDLPIVAALAGVPPEIGERLVEIGLWHATEGGYEVHQYLTHNPSREQVVARKERAEKAANARHHPATSNASSKPSWNADALPIPSPSPVALSSSSPVTETGVPEEVWSTLARRKLAVAKNVKNVPSWTRRVIQNDRVELGPRAEELWGMFEITPSQLADVLAAGGNSSTLNSLKRKQPA